MIQHSVASMVEDEARCRITSPAEIVAILRSLQEDRALISLYVGENDFVLSSVLAVRAGVNDFIVDCGADDNANTHVLRSRKLRVLGWQEQIRVEFDSGPAHAVLFEGRPAFVLPLPASLVRLQRREYYRIKIPLSESLHCHVEFGAPPNVTRATMRILDLSCGGVALVDVPAILALEAGRTYANCRIDLPDTGIVTTDIAVRHVNEMQGREGDVIRRCGCCFVNLVPGTVTLIQRYINRYERKRLTRG
jgi:c-di-GMP-binding flagellar brake protein YcgR